MEKKEEMRKGPWAEQEDVQLVFYVNLFGDRRWDFVAKVSGLKRTGKSCRLRWVNYLHPGLKRGKLTPLEKRLILELHSKWGNRWSRIARKLPGRTDNEIKNYWRTHTRKEAQEKKKYISSSSSYLSGEGLVDASGASKTCLEVEESTGAYSMDEIWKDIELSEEISNLTSCSSDVLVIDSLWSIDGEESKMGDHFHCFPFSNHMSG